MYRGPSWENVRAGDGEGVWAGERIWGSDGAWGDAWAGAGAGVSATWVAPGPALQAGTSGGDGSGGDGSGEVAGKAGSGSDAGRDPPSAGVTAPGPPRS